MKYIIYFFIYHCLGFNLHYPRQIATIGPASNTYNKIKKLHDNGVSMFRINLSHTSKKEAEKVVKSIKKVKEESDNALEILVDLQGPKFRIGKMKHSSIFLTEGNYFTFDQNEKLGDCNRVCLPHPQIFDSISANETILLNDGLIELSVISCSSDKIQTKVIKSGLLQSHKGVNIPQIELNCCSLTEKDLSDIFHINTLDIEWVALSFVESAKNIETLRSKLRDDIKIIAKIERPKAIQNIDTILQCSEGIMVARGDLGIEVGLEHLPYYQKFLVTKARSCNRDVIVATQMMESMIDNPIPTRAEVLDTANAVIDGCTGIMLSGETAVGNYGVECVQFQKKIIDNLFDHFENGAIKM